MYLIVEQNSQLPTTLWEITFPTRMILFKKLSSFTSRVDYDTSRQRYVFFFLKDVHVQKEHDYLIFRYHAICATFPLHVFIPKRCICELRAKYMDVSFRMKWSRVVYTKVKYNLINKIYFPSYFLKIVIKDVQKHKISK